MRDRYPQPVLPLLLRLLKTLHVLLFLLLDLQQLCTLCTQHFTQHFAYHGLVLLRAVVTDMSLLMASKAKAMRFNLAEIHGLPLSTKNHTHVGLNQSGGSWNKWASFSDWVSL